MPKKCLSCCSLFGCLKTKLVHVPIHPVLEQKDIEFLYCQTEPKQTKQNLKTGFT